MNIKNIWKSMLIMNLRTEDMEVVDWTENILV